MRSYSYFFVFYFRFENFEAFLFGRVKIVFMTVGVILGCVENLRSGVK